MVRSKKTNKKNWNGPLNQLKHFGFIFSSLFIGYNLIVGIKFPIVDSIDYCVSIDSNERIQPSGVAKKCLVSLYFCICDSNRDT